MFNQELQFSASSTLQHLELPDSYNEPIIVWPPSLKKICINNAGGILNSNALKAIRNRPKTVKLYVNNKLTDSKKETQLVNEFDSI